MKLESPKLQKIPAGSSVHLGGPVYWRTVEQIERKTKAIRKLPRGQALDEWLKKAKKFKKPSPGARAFVGWDNHTYYTGPYPRYIGYDGTLPKYVNTWPITWYVCPSCEELCVYIPNHVISTCRHVLCYVTPKVIPRDFYHKDENCKILMERKPYWIFNRNFRIGYERVKKAEDEDLQDRVLGEGYALSL
jgi:hypothetical protein